MNTPPPPALSDLSVTEFLTLSRVGFLPRGLVIGSCVFEAGDSIYKAPDPRAGHMVRGRRIDYEEVDTIEHVYEPYLLRLGFIERGPQGRLLTQRGKQYLSGDKLL